MAVNRIYDTNYILNDVYVHSNGSIRVRRFDDNFIFNAVYDPISKGLRINKIENLKSTDITDMPQTLTPQKYLKVKTDGTGYELVDIASTDLTDMPAVIEAGKFLRGNTTPNNYILTDIDTTDLTDMPQSLISYRYLRINATGTDYELVSIHDSTGVFEFAGVTVTSNTTFNVSPVKGWIVKNTDNANKINPEVILVDYAGGTGLNTPYLLTHEETYLLIDEAGLLVLQTTQPTPEQRRTHLSIGHICHPELILDEWHEKVDVDQSIGSQLRDMFIPMKFINDGVIPSPIGANLTFKTTTGYLYGLGINYTNDIKDPSRVLIPAYSPASFKYKTRLGGTAGYTTLIDPTKYDVAGVITAVPGGTKQTTIQRIYVNQLGEVRVQYGQNVYATLADAIANAAGESHTTYLELANHSQLIGLIAITKSCTSLTDTANAKFLLVSKFGENSPAGAGVPTTSLQQAYDNSLEPEILTNAVNDGVTIARGSALITDAVLQIKGSSGGAVTNYITGEGRQFGTSLRLTELAGTGDRDVYVDSDGDILQRPFSSLTTDIKRYGFVDPAQTSISFNDTTMLFTLTAVTPTWDYYRAGVKYTITGNKTVSLTGAPTPAAALYFIYIDGTDGTLVDGTSPWTLEDTRVPIALIYFNSALTPKYHLMDERHTTLIDRRMHWWAHQTVGSRFLSGAVLTGPSLTTATNDGVCYGISATTFADEDIKVSLPVDARPTGAAGQTNYMIFYRTAPTTWIWQYNNSPYRYTAAGYIQYDLNGVMTQGQNNKFYNTYLVLTNISGANAYVTIHGRGEYGTLADAQAEDITKQSFTGFDIKEAIFYYQFTWDTSASYTNFGKCRLSVAPVLINTSIATSSLPTNINHNSLTGLEGYPGTEYYHSAYDVFFNTHFTPANTLLGNNTGIDGLVKTFGIGSGLAFAAGVLNTSYDQDLDTTDSVTFLKLRLADGNLDPLALSYDLTRYYLAGKSTDITTGSNLGIALGTAATDVAGFGIIWEDSGANSRGRTHFLNKIAESATVPLRTHFKLDGIPTYDATSWNAGQYVVINGNTYSGASTLIIVAAINAGTDATAVWLSTTAFEIYLSVNSSYTLSYTTGGGFLVAYNDTKTDSFTEYVEPLKYSGDGTRYYTTTKRKIMIDPSTHRALGSRTFDGYAYTNAALAFFRSSAVYTFTVTSLDCWVYNTLIPADYKENTDITMDIWYYTSSNAVTGDFVLYINASRFRHTDGYNNHSASFIWSTYVTFTQIESSNGILHKLTVNLPISTETTGYLTGMLPGDKMPMMIGRPYTIAGDTATDTLYIADVVLNYTHNKIGV